MRLKSAEIRLGAETRLQLVEELKRAVDDPKQRFTHMSGICLHVFENEARIHHSEWVTPEHMLFTLLQDGTDTSAFLDRADWRQRLEAEMPSFEDGPKFPKLSRAVNMSIVTNTVHRLRKPMPEDVESLTKEQSLELMERDHDEAEVFTDLYWIKNLPEENGTFVGGLFLEAGITQEAVLAAIRERTSGDPDWSSKKPAYPEEAYKMASPRSALACKRISDFIWGLAEFEARSRHAPEITVGHLVHALCAEGTDTSHFLKSEGFGSGGAH